MGMGMMGGGTYDGGTYDGGGGLTSPYKDAKVLPKDPPIKGRTP